MQRHASRDLRPKQILSENPPSYADKPTEDAKVSLQRKIFLGKQVTSGSADRRRTGLGGKSFAPDAMRTHSPSSRS
ncbi:hypothetical protein SBA5_580065 [Candidatus Sulfotelmatomonas gaucii]|uniref:Uncharacterized protein n=1 Tax=Candidatus Sulfuritelmatomonas gaucii TaxID=2043161 RepID=A0A2N9LVD7_9BACT|nr:hypothetical protein SBA5_580065 [Candidatus Sulfotelmatomonas gaucii]